MNRAFLLGRIGRNPEIRYSQQGTTVVKLSIATSEKWYDKASGEKKEETQWHRCTAFGKTAELISKYVKKGDQLQVIGKIKYGSYEKDGVKVYTTDIVINEIEFISAPKNTVEQKAPEQRQQMTNQELDDDIPF